MNKRKKLIVLLSVLIVIACICLGTAYYLLLAPQFHPQKTVYIYIDKDDIADSVYHKIRNTAAPDHLTGLYMIARLKQYDDHIHTGRYAIHPNDNVYHAFGRLLRGHQEPVNLVINSVRTLNQLARNVGRQLMIDSTDVIRGLQDSVYWEKLGYTKEMLPCLFIPDTYQVYWDTDTEDFFKRMVKEHDRFWNKKTTEPSRLSGYDTSRSNHTGLHCRRRNQQCAGETNNSRLIPQPFTRRHAAPSRPDHQICLARLWLEKNQQHTPGDRLPLQHISVCRPATGPHTNPFTCGNRCRTELYTA